MKLEKALHALQNTLKPGYDGSARLIIRGVGTLYIREGSATCLNGDHDVTLTATPEVFRSLMTGEIKPQTAYMTGKLVIDGDLGAAMELARYLR